MLTHLNNKKESFVKQKIPTVFCKSVLACIDMYSKKKMCFYFISGHHLLWYFVYFLKNFSVWRNKCREEFLMCNNQKLRCRNWLHLWHFIVHTPWQYLSLSLLCARAWFMLLLLLFGGFVHKWINKNLIRSLIIM